MVEADGEFVIIVDISVKGNYFLDISVEPDCAAKNGGFAKKPADPP